MAGVDICNPPLLWLEGRCYRLGREQEREVVAGYTGETEAEDWSELGQDGAEVEVEIEQLTGGRWRAALQLPATLFPQIIGKGGQTKGRRVGKPIVIRGWTRGPCWSSQVDHAGKIIVRGGVGVGGAGDVDHNRVGWTCNLHSCGGTQVRG